MRKAAAAGERNGRERYVREFDIAGERQRIVFRMADADAVHGTVGKAQRAGARTDGKVRRLRKIESGILHREGRRASALNPEGTYLRIDGGVLDRGIDGGVLIHGEHDVAQIIGTAVQTIHINVGRRSIRCNPCAVAEETTGIYRKVRAVMRRAVGSRHGADIEDTAVTAVVVRKGGRRSDRTATLRGIDEVTGRSFDTQEIIFHLHGVPVQVNIDRDLVIFTADVESLRGRGADVAVEGQDNRTVRLYLPCGKHRIRHHGDVVCVEVFCRRAVGKRRKDFFYPGNSRLGVDRLAYQLFRQCLEGQNLPLGVLEHPGAVQLAEPAVHNDLSVRRLVRRGRAGEPLIALPILPDDRDQIFRRCGAIIRCPRPFCAEEGEKFGRKRAFCRPARKNQSAAERGVVRPHRGERAVRADDDVTRVTRHVDDTAVDRGAGEVERTGDRRAGGTGGIRQQGCVGGEEDLTVLDKDLRVRRVLEREEHTVRIEFRVADMNVFQTCSRIDRCRIVVQNREIVTAVDRESRRVCVDKTTARPGEVVAVVGLLHHGVVYGTENERCIHGEGCRRTRIFRGIGLFFSVNYDGGDAEIAALLRRVEVRRLARQLEEVILFDVSLSVRRDRVTVQVHVQAVDLNGLRDVVIAVEDEGRSGLCRCHRGRNVCLATDHGQVLILIINKRAVIGHGACLRIHFKVTVDLFFRHLREGLPVPEPCHEDAERAVRILYRGGKCHARLGKVAEGNGSVGNEHAAVDIIEGKVGNLRRLREDISAG